jgi:adenylate cyclase
MAEDLPVRAPDGSLAQHFEEYVLGGRREFTKEQVAAAAGTGVAQARRFWRALGFPNSGDGAVAFTEADVVALRRALAMVRGGFDEDFTVQMIRSLGHTMNHLAEWQVQALYEYLTEERGLGREESVQTAAELATGHLPQLQELLVYVWRRQLAAVAGRVLTPSDPEAAAGELSVGFADLVSYTSLAARLDGRALALLMNRFVENCTDVIAANLGRLVKTVGDEVLFVAERVDLAAEIALTLTESMARDEVLPDVRVGLTRGYVVSRLGDVFGTTVNLASRLTAIAPPGCVLIDERTAAALAGHPTYDVRPESPRVLRGIGELRTASLARRTAQPAAPG